MTRRVKGRKLWSCWLLAIGLSSLPGCLNSCHSVSAPPKEQLEPCRAISCVNRKCVHVFLLNGTDALACANMQGVQKYLFDLGFINTYYGEAYHNAWFRDEIRRIHKEEPDARFVLVGYDIGAKAACNVAKWTNGNGITYDLIVYIDPCMLDDDATCRPENAGEVFNIVSSSGKSLAAAEEVTVPEAGHYSVPTHSATLCFLTNQLIKLAEQVTPMAPPEAMPILGLTPGIAVPATPPTDEMAPTPRPVQPQEPSAQRGEWDFLKPSTQLHVMTAPDAATAQRTGDWQRAATPYPVEWGRVEPAPGRRP